MFEDHEPCYIISVAAEIVGIHPQTLRHYERIGLIAPERSEGNVRLYSERDLVRVRQIRRLVDDLGVNLAGVEVILNLTERVEVMQAEMDRLHWEMEAEISRLRQLVGELP
ncbi:MAG: helix-turn-helix transcriptional regulator [Chloroflexi bacterium]|nr:helix-turn-helix transcriptional regulator [Chloroflexota bacterium]MBU1748874.1 helix-turn-helix transcriptional regulator [Chloroflexota bacterium]